MSTIEVGDLVSLFDSHMTGYSRVVGIETPKDGERILHIEPGDHYIFESHCTLVARGVKDERGSGRGDTPPQRTRKPFMGRG